MGRWDEDYREPVAAGTEECSELAAGKENKDKTYVESKPRITEIIQSVCENMCDNYCKYRETCYDENDNMREECKNCPLDILT